MKSLVVLCSVFVISNALDKAIMDELIEKIQEYGIECAQQEQIPPDDMERLINKQAPISHEGKCTIFCVMKKFNIMKDATTMGPGDTPWLEKARSNDPEFYNNLFTVYKTCEPQVRTTDDGCENANLLAECSKDEGRKLGLDQF